MVCAQGCRLKSWALGRLFTVISAQQWGKAKIRSVVYRQGKTCAHCSPSTNSSYLSRAAGISSVKAHMGPDDAQKSMTRHAHEPPLLHQYRGRELCYASLYSKEILQLCVWQRLGSPVAEWQGEPHTSREILPLADRWCLQGVLCAKDSPASPAGSCLCREINFLTKKQSFLSCNLKLLHQHFTYQLFTTKSKKNNFKIWRMEGK